MAEEIIDTATSGDSGTVPNSGSGVADPVPGGVTSPPSGPEAIVGDWPEDWRVKMSGGDAKAQARLDRMGSPKDLYASYKALEQKLSSGELKSSLQEGATEEQVAAYRKDNGIPESAAGYLENMPDGLVIGEDDKATIDSFAEAMHGRNVPPEVVHEAVKWYYDLQEQAAGEQYERDDNMRIQTEESLRGEWGNAYLQNINIIKGFLAGAPEGIREDFVNARFPDGTPIFSKPETLTWMANLARQVNPMATISPGSGTNTAATVADEMANIQKKMGDKTSDYWKGPKSASMQARYLELADWSARNKNA